ncbi:MAG: sugar transferase [Candidatus Nanopelagicales bacterium]
MVAPAATPTSAHQAGVRETYQRRAMVITDLVMIAVAVGAVLAAGIGASAPLRLDTPRQFIAGALLLLWPLMLWEMQTRATTILGTGSEEYRRVLVASLWALVFAAAGAYAIGSSRARDALLAMGLLGIVLLLVGRNLMRIRLHRHLSRCGPLHRVFVVAPGSADKMLSEQLERTDGMFARVGGVTLPEQSDPDPGLVVQGALDAGADTILYAPGHHADPRWPRRLGWAMEDTVLSLLVSPALADVAGPRLSIEPIEGLALLRVDLPRFSGPARVVKRSLDIVGSTVGIALLAIPMLVIALVIKLDSKGPVFFRQRRAGVDGTTFLCWKFRTMYADADDQRAALRREAASDGATFKMAADPRITRFGGFLRRWSIDEVPQLLNVFVGEMSLVGPRPHPLDDVERYDDVATRRLLTKPGMTGLWQVSGRSDLTWEAAVTLDLSYIENWTLSLDIVILMRTLKAVLAGKGAY